ncbi:MAG: NAD(P)H-dependent oxidoreductase subunit E, partial [Bacteroidetes bacterium]|nr:NAD(P)H-dependent oxidoreductase subunit E [Bacteroidota bacterium]
GEHVINVCTNISCLLRGSKEIVEHLNKRLDVRFGETTKDNKFTLVEVECQGACAGAPMCEIDKIYHENLTVNKIDKIVDKIMKKNGEG